MNHPLYQLILARVREFTREPEAMFWTYGFPLAMAIALGIAFRERPVERVSVDVAQESAEIAMHLRETKSLKVEVHPSQECLERLRTGKTDVVVNETNNGYTFHYDQAKPTSVLARNAVNDALQRYAGRADPKVATDVILKEPGGRYIDFLVPGLLGMSLMGGGMWGVGFVTVDMRIRKLLKRFLATPMKRSHFLIAVMVSRMLFMIPEVLLLLIFARLVFGVVIYGNLLALVALILLGALMFSGIGLLMATRAQTLGNHFRLDEPLHAPHVDHVRNLFLRRPFPGCRSTLPANSAAHAFDRRHPQRHVGGGHLELTRLGTGQHADLERG